MAATREDRTSFIALVLFEQEEAVFDEYLYTGILLQILDGGKQVARWRLEEAL
ncbi:hypothetical protein GCM10009077_22170 [Roseibium denhamense]